LIHYEIINPIQVEEKKYSGTRIKGERLNNAWLEVCYSKGELRPLYGFLQSTHIRAAYVYKEVEVIEFSLIVMTCGLQVCPSSQSAVQPAIGY
jgi:hypothetical protein